MLKKDFKLKRKLQKSNSVQHHWTEEEYYELLGKLAQEKADFFHMQHSKY